MIEWKFYNINLGEKQSLFDKRTKINYKTVIKGCTFCFFLSIIFSDLLIRKVRNIEENYFSHGSGPTYRKQCFGYDRRLFEMRNADKSD